MLRQATLGDVDFITGDYLAGQFLISVPAKIILLLCSEG